MFVTFSPVVYAIALFHGHARFFGHVILATSRFVGFHYICRDSIIVELFENESYDVTPIA